jgi:hypothetical protein
MADEQVVEATVEETAVEETPKQEQPMLTKNEVEMLVKQRVDKERKSWQRKFEGVDAEEYRTMKTTQESEEVERQKERGEFETVLKQSIEKEKTVSDGYKEQLRKLKVDSALLAAASEERAINAEQVTNLLHDQVRMTDEGAVEIVDGTGVVRYNESGELMTPKALVSEFLSANPHFVSATPGGIGSQSAIGGPAQANKSIMDMEHNEYKDWRKDKRNVQPGYIKPKNVVLE